MTLLVLTVFASEATAGIIFLKNGYILQAPVDEKFDSHVVLKYPSGKVTVEKRFIKHVVLDPGEEALLEQRSTQDDPGSVEDERLTSNASMLELPSDLATIIELNRSKVSTLNQPVENPNPNGNTNPGNTNPGDSNPGTVESVPQQFPKPSEAQFSGFALTATLPPNWKLKEESGVATLTPEDEELPRITLEKVELEVELDRAFDLLVATLRADYPALEIGEETQGTVAGQPARIVYGKAPDQELGFTQYLFELNSQLYMIGVRQPMASSYDQRIEQLLTSIQTKE